MFLILIKIFFLRFYNCSYIKLFSKWKHKYDFFLEFTSILLNYAQISFYVVILMCIWENLNFLILNYFKK